MFFERWNLGRFAWLAPTLMLLIVLVTIGGSYYVWHRWEFSRAYHTLADEEYEQTIRHADRLIAFGYDKDRARRYRALALAEIEPEQGIFELRELVNKPDGAFDAGVHLRLGELLRDTNQIEELQKLLDGFPEWVRSNPRFLILKAESQAAEDNPSAAYQTLEDLLTLAPHHPEANFKQASLLLSLNPSVEQILAKVHLRRAAESMGPYGMRALLTLATDPRIPVFPEDRQLLAEQLRLHPESTPQTRLLAATQQLLARTEEPAAVIERAISEEGEDGPKMVANWLLRIGAPQRAVEFLTLGEGRNLPASINAELKLNAYLAMNDFSAVKELVADQENGLPEPIRTAALAIADAVLATSDSSEGTPEWRTAYDLMREQENLQAVLVLADLAMNRGWMDEAQESYEWGLDQSQDPAQDLRILRSLQILYSARKDSEALLNISRAILAINPNDILAKNNVYYLEPLLGDPPDADPERFKDLVERFPGQLFHSGYAFSLWKNGDLERAAAQHSLLDKRNFENPAVCLVGSLIAYDTGNLPKARELFDRIDPNHLLPEEAELYNNLADRLEKQ